jgi:tetratricopeptide (TPR) repeat protein
VGDRLGEANVHFALGEAARMTGDYVAAERGYHIALASYRQIGARVGEANVLDSLGEIAEAQKKWAEAQRWFAQALAIYRAIGASYAAVTERNLARVARQV